MTEPYEWLCADCRAPIMDEQGYLGVDERAAAERRMNRARPTGPRRLSDVERFPLVPWAAHHDLCRSQEGYWISVDEIRTLEQLLGWNRHLAEKTWIADTDWAWFIERQLTRPRDMFSSAS